VTRRSKKGCSEDKGKAGEIAAVQIPETRWQSEVIEVWAPISFEYMIIALLAAAVVLLVHQREDSYWGKLNIHLYLDTGMPVLRRSARGPGH
jgi:hypothetical protein